MPLLMMGNSDHSHKTLHYRQTYSVTYLLHHHYLMSAPLLMRNSTGLMFERITCLSARHCRASNERWRDAPDVRGWRTSAVRGEEAGRFRKVAGVSIVVAGSQRFRNKYFNGKQPSGLISR